MRSLLYLRTQHKENGTTGSRMMIAARTNAAFAIDARTTRGAQLRLALDLLLISP